MFIEIHTIRTCMSVCYFFNCHTKVSIRDMYCYQDHVDRQQIITVYILYMFGMIFLFYYPYVPGLRYICRNRLCQRIKCLMFIIMKLRGLYCMFCVLQVEYYMNQITRATSYYNHNNKIHHQYIDNMSVSKTEERGLIPRWCATNYKHNSLSLLTLKNKILCCITYN